MDPGSATGAPGVTFSVTTCRRLELFRRTMDSFLGRCRDPERISRWLCVDDGSTDDDLAAMQRAHPALEIVSKAPADRGHAGSIRTSWRACDTELLLHFEDDWLVEEPFSVTELVAQLGDADQLQLLWDRRRYQQEFNPQHPLISPRDAALMERYGYATQPRSEGGWWWPGFSLNPSLLRVGRCRELAPRVPDGEQFELELALQLRRGGFRVRHRMFGLRHLGGTSAYVLKGSPRSYEVDPLLEELAATCAREPRRAIEVFSHLDPDRLEPEQAIRAYHALAAAQWYVEREAGRRTLVEMWRRLHATGQLWTVELAQLLGFYGETWESLARAEESAEASGRPSPIVAARFDADATESPVNDPTADVTVAITTCRRLDLFERTVRSFLACCTDLHLVARWLCVDDNSSSEDRTAMRRLFPWLELICRDAPDRGHGGSLQRILDEVSSPYVFLLEDDHELFVASDYLTRCRRGLSVSPRVGQCLLNRNYAETPEQEALAGGMRFRHRGESFVAHLYDPEHRVVHGRSSAHWPHFSLRPGLNRTTAWRLGFRNEPAFELELAHRYKAAGFVTVFLDGVHHRHIGRLTSEAGANAYTLNDMVQF